MQRKSRRDLFVGLLLNYQSLHNRGRRMQTRTVFLVILTVICLPMMAFGPGQSSGQIIPSASLSFPNAISIPATDASSILSPGTIKFTNPKNYRVQDIITAVNKSFNLTELQVYLPRPVGWDGQKNVKIEQVTPTPTMSGKDPVYGNGITYWQTANKPQPGSSMQFKIQFTLTAYKTATTVNLNNIPPYNKNGVIYKLYTRPERFIESTDPQIVALAKKVAGSETNPYRLERKFYDYIIANFQYKLVGKGLLGAKALLKNGQGECGDFSALFIALSRAKGIPARPVVGFWAESGLHPHVWAEFYIENLGWIPVDPTIGKLEPSQHNYYFGNMDNQRVILSKGFNIHLVPAAPSNYTAPLLQTYVWFFWGNGGNASTVSVTQTTWKVTPIP
jgi:transglutaminase-like putative cysteine protease